MKAFHQFVAEANTDNNKPVFVWQPGNNHFAGYSDWGWIYPDGKTAFRSSGSHGAQIQTICQRLGVKGYTGVGVFLAMGFVRFGVIWDDDEISVGCSALDTPETRAILIRYIRSIPADNDFMEVDIDFYDREKVLQTPTPSFTVSVHKRSIALRQLGGKHSTSSLQRLGSTCGTPIWPKPAPANHATQDADDG